MGVGVREWGVTRWEQVIITGQRVRVSLRIGWQEKNVSWNIITMGTCVGSHKLPHRRRITVIKKPGYQRGVLGLALALTLDLGLSLSYMSSVHGPSSITLFLIPLA